LEIDRIDAAGRGKSGDPFTPLSAAFFDFASGLSISGAAAAIRKKAFRPAVVRRGEIEVSPCRPPIALASRWRAGFGKFPPGKKNPPALFSGLAVVNWGAEFDAVSSSMPFEQQSRRDPSGSLARLSV